MYVCMYVCMYQGTSLFPLFFNDNFPQHIAKSFPLHERGHFNPALFTQYIQIFAHNGQAANHMTDKPAPALFSGRKFPQIFHETRHSLLYL